MRIELGAATHVGLVREINEDSILAENNLAVIADGMGGHARGDLASRRAVEQFKTLAAADHLSPAQIEGAIDAANRSILDEVAVAPELAGMGTTLAGVALIQYGGTPHWLVFNIGDSRVYRINRAGVEQLTVDHSEVAELIAAGQLTRQEARTHPARHVITRSLGTDPAPVADVWIFPTSPDGDTFVACTDGLTNEVSEHEIAAIVHAAHSPRDAAANLVDAAVTAGGRDNVTAAVVALAPTVTDDVEVATAPRGGRA